jgi:polygalacturonase
LVESKDVRIGNIRIRNTPAWGIHPLVCDRVLIRGISMITDYRGPNTDGIDPDSTRNLTISDTYIETGDDAIVTKTTGRLGEPVPPTENVAITNSVLMSDDAAIKLGTESHGGFGVLLCMVAATHYRTAPGRMNRE